MEQMDAMGMDNGSVVTTLMNQLTVSFPEYIRNKHSDELKLLLNYLFFRFTVFKPNSHVDQKELRRDFGGYLNSKGIMNHVNSKHFKKTMYDQKLYAGAIISSEPGPAMKLQNLKYIFPNESSKIKLFVLSVILPYLSDKFQDFLSYNNWGKNPNVPLSFLKVLKCLLKCLIFCSSS